MRHTILAVCLLLLAGSAFGQSTTVTLNVTDVGAQAWANGSYEFRLNPNPQYPNLGTYTWTGGTLLQSITGSLNGSGVATPSIPSNSAITPGGSTWVIKVCPQATAQCFFSVATIITGATQTVNLTPPAIAITLSNPPGAFTLAYADAEIVSTPLGGQYYNLTSNTTRTCTAVTGTTCTTWSSGSTTGPSIAAPNQSYWYLVPQSQGCGTLTNCTAIFGDGKVITDGTSNSTTTFTCPNSDCNFTAADVGKTFWATTQGTGAGGTFNNTTYVCPVTTIASITNTQTVVLNLACTASGTANVVAIWGHRDGATLHALDGNAVGCVNISIFSGATVLIDQAEFITAPTCSGSLQTVTGYPQKDWIPRGNTTNLIMTPDFNYATCTGNGGTHTGSTVCIGSGLNELDNTGIWGTGLTPAANANCANASGKTILALNPTNAALKNTNLSGICPGETGEGAELAVPDEQWIGGGAQYVMSQPCVISNVGVVTSLLDCRNDAISGSFGMTVVSGGAGTDISTFPFVGLHVASGGTFSSRGTNYCGVHASIQAIQVDSGGTLYSASDFIGVNCVASDATGIAINGQVQSTNTTYKSSTGVAMQFGTGTFVSLGGNTVSGTGGVQYFSGNSEVGWDVLQGSCTGVVTSASTIGLFGLGNNTTTTCTSTTTNIGPVMGKAGTIFSVGCFATAGNQAADACTVMKNNVATALTCSLNGVAFCGDGTAAHQVAYVQGDIITVKVVSGTSTTLANVKASVLAW